MHSEGLFCIRRGRHKRALLPTRDSRFASSAIHEQHPAAVPPLPKQLSHGSRSAALQTDLPSDPPGP